MLPLIPVTKFGHLSWSFQFSFFPGTKSGHLSWSFLVSSLKVTNFGHLSLEKTSGDQITNYSFCTSACYHHLHTLEIYITAIRD